MENYGLIFLSMGTLGKMTMRMMGLAEKSSQSGLISLQKINKALTGRDNNGR